MTRRGLVLGGGGVLGAAWMVGALTALEDHLGMDLRTMDEYVGTSAGSVVAALLAGGVAVSEMRQHQLEGFVDDGLLAGYEWSYEEATGGADRPASPRFGLGSPELLRKRFLRRHQLPPAAVLAAIVPEGRGRLDSIGAMVRHVVGDGWVARDGLAVAAFDYDDGVRVAFGRRDAPPAATFEAVMASCAIPGWYQPMRIGERRYIDGGTWSSTNLDLAQGRGLDEVYVLAPQVSYTMDSPRAPLPRLERQWRARVTVKARREAAALREEGVRVLMLGPGPRDLATFGANLMDVGRRPAVIETSLETSVLALADPAVYDDTGDQTDGGDPGDGGDLSDAGDSGGPAERILPGKEESPPGATGSRTA